MLYVQLPSTERHGKGVILKAASRKGSGACSSSLTTRPESGSLLTALQLKSIPSWAAGSNTFSSIDSAGLVWGKISIVGEVIDWEGSRHRVMLSFWQVQCFVRGAKGQEITPLGTRHRSYSGALSMSLCTHPWYVLVWAFMVSIK